jgi:hypothetical protein
MAMSSTSATSIPKAHFAWHPDSQILGKVQSVAHSLPTSILQAHHPVADLID